MRRSPLAILAYYVESFGAGAGLVGALMSMFSLAQFIFAPLWGSASDRVGRRPILLIGLAGSVLGYTMFGFAASLVWLFAARILAGIAGATIPTAQAYIADSTTPENRAKGMGMIGAAFGLGFILGPALGGLLSRVALPLANRLGDGAFANLLRSNPYALPSFAAAALAAVNFLAAIFLLPESLSPELRQRAIANRIGRLEAVKTGLTGEVGIYVAGFALFVIGHSMMEATATLLIELRLHVELVGDIGWLFALVGVVSTVMQGALTGRLSKRFGERALLIAGLFISSCALLLIPIGAQLGRWSTILPTFGLLAVGAGLTSPSVNSLISRSAPPDRQGATLGVAQSAGSLARVVGPLLGGVLFQRVTPGMPYWSAASLTALALLLIASRSVKARSFA